MKELNVKIVKQQKVIEEMHAKENMNFIKDTDEDVPNIVVKELKGRNVTILKTKTGNNPPKTPTVIATVEENNLVENVNKQSEEITAQAAVDRTEHPKLSENEKVKPKRTKITKKVIEERLIAAFVNDIEYMQNETKESYVEGTCYACKKCEFETKSEGMFKRHKVLIHDSRETNQNVILGFESDVQKYARILEGRGNSLEKFKCKECEYAIYSN